MSFSVNNSTRVKFDESWLNGTTSLHVRLCLIAPSSPVLFRLRCTQMFTNSTRDVERDIVASLSLILCAKSRVRQDKGNFELVCQNVQLT